jgi:hypothetical protein
MNGIRARMAPAIVALLGFGAAAWASALCDILDGPVVTAARLALRKGDPTPVLKWVRPSPWGANSSPPTSS